MENLQSRKKHAEVQLVAGRLGDARRAPCWYTPAWRNTRDRIIHCAQDEKS
jgi:hypothetical protein